MKMLRVTTERQDGTFDGYLNQELEMQPNSQIALQSATFETSDKGLVIDATTDALSFQTANVSGLQSIRLAHTDGVGGRPDQYDSTNLQVFFDDVTNRINSQFRPEFNNQIGRQFLLTEGKSTTSGKQGYVQAMFATSAFQARRTELLGNVRDGDVSGVSGSNATLLMNASGVLGSNLPADTPLDSNNNEAYKRRTHYTHPITKGCGLLRAKVARFENIAAGKGGFTIALSTRNPSLATVFTRSQIKAGIQVLERKDANAASFYTTIADGAAPAVSAVNANLATTAANALNNDHVELMVRSNASGSNTGDSRVIEANVYRRTDDGAQPTYTKTTLATIPYATDAEAGNDLYAYVFIHGAQQPLGTFNCRLSTFRFTADPFMESPGLFVNGVLDSEGGANDSEETSLGAKPEPARGSSNHMIDFGSEEVSEWLVYETQRQPPTAFASGRRINLIAQNLFSSKIKAESFLVQLLNLPVEAYDTFPAKRGRENLLAVIPASDETNSVIYEPNNLHFLDLSNKFPLKLSNVRLRVLRHDYSTVQTRGLSSVVLVFK